MVAPLFFRESQAISKATNECSSKSIGHRILLNLRTPQTLPFSPDRTPLPPTPTSATGVIIFSDPSHAAPPTEVRACDPKTLAVSGAGRRPSSPRLCAPWESAVHPRPRASLRSQLQIRRLFSHDRQSRTVLGSQHSRAPSAPPGAARRRSPLRIPHTGRSDRSQDDQTQPQIAPKRLSDSSIKLTFNSMLS